jgi:pimeloyl-ACP methyl ester carboxylesterase
VTSDSHGRAGWVAAATVALLLAGCTSNSTALPGGSSGVTTSSTAATSTSTSTSTTTTLPVPVAVQGTSQPGSAFLGLVKRAAVVAVPVGKSTEPLPVVGARGYLSVQRIAFRSFGSGPDLLLLMGQDGTMSWWEPSLLSALAQHYRVTVFDLPGVGYSSPPLVPVTLDWLADETAGLIQALALAHPVVLGWGLGGAIALALAEGHPASERALVLVDASGGGLTATRPAVGVRALLDSPTVTAASLASTFFAAGTSSGLAGGAGSPKAAESAWLTSVEASVPDVTTRSTLASERALELELWSGNALLAKASAVVVPTLVIFGSADAVFPAPDGVLLRRAIAGSERVELPDAGYASMFEDPTQFVAALETFTG